MFNLVTVYVIAGIAALVIAIILVNLAMASGQARLQVDRKLPGESFAADKGLSHSVYEEIDSILSRERSKNEINRKVNEVVSREIEKKVIASVQEIKKKYETEIDVRAKNEEIAWKKYNKALSDKRNTDAVIRSIAEGLVVVDAHGKVVMMNPAAERLLGVSRKEKLGKPITEGQREEQLVSLMKGSPDQEDKEIELSSSQDETKKVLRASSAVIENENGQTIGMVSVLSDITKQKELDRLKSTFVASVSHELRTPLVAIEKSISLMLARTTGEINEAQQKFLEIAERNIKRLSRLINDLLDLSKLEAGKMELKPVPGSIERVISDCIDTLDNWAKTKSIQLKKDVEEGIPQFSFDPDRVTQVLTNLIGNAIKFTPNDGTITVGASLDGPSGAVKVRVSDTGIGIAPENIGRVFDKFYQIGERVSTDITGTGIGLSVSKEIIELHGGKIWVESEKGVGTTFFFLLPLAVS